MFSRSSRLARRVFQSTKKSKHQSQKELHNESSVRNNQSIFENFCANKCNEIIHQVREKIIEVEENRYEYKENNYHKYHEKHDGSGSGVYRMIDGNGTIVGTRKKNKQGKVIEYQIGTQPFKKILLENDDFQGLHEYGSQEEIYKLLGLDRTDRNTAGKRKRNKKQKLKSGKKNKNKSKRRKGSRKK